MSWIPGWDSVTSTTLWSNIFFWAGIAALLFLGVSEVVSHRYTERKDELVAEEQSAAGRRHDEEIARLHLETAQAEQRAGEANAGAAEANTRAANLETAAAAANERAAEIMKVTAWRQFQPQQIAVLSQAFSARPGKVEVAWISNDSESMALAIQLINLLSGTGWQVTTSSRAYGDRLLWGIQIPANSGSPDDDKFLVDLFKSIGVTPSTEDLPTPGMSFGSGAPHPDFPTILVGSRRPSLTQAPN